jgi:hypothetical protein
MGRLASFQCGQIAADRQDIGTGASGSQRDGQAMLPVMHRPEPCETTIVANPANQ